jgi:beta-lactamase regulating signal transducer with metallopeptidase domain/outer membrane protein TolC
MFTLLLPEWRILPDWLLVENRAEAKLSSADDQADFKSIKGMALDQDSAELRGDRRISVASLPMSERSISTEPSFQTTEPRLLPKDLPAPFTMQLSSSLFLVVWSAGVLIGLCPLIVSLMRLYRMERAKLPNTNLNSRIAKRIKWVSFKLGIQAPLVVVGPEGAMPMVWTFVRSRLLLPSDATTWSRSKLNAVLLHELIHLRRRDPIVCTLALIARSLNWFNPLAWYAIKRLRAECELACDDQVLQLGVEPIDYAGHLLDLSTNFRFSRTTSALAMAMASRPCVEERIMAILNERRNRKSVTFNRVAVALIGGVVFTALLATIATRAAVSKEFLQGEETKTEVSLEAATVLEQESLPLKEPVTKQELKDESKPNKLPFKVLDLSLEQCIIYALNNTQVIKPIPGIRSSETVSESTTSGEAKSELPHDATRGTPREKNAGNEFNNQFTSFLKHDSKLRARQVGKTNVAADFTGEPESRSEQTRTRPDRISEIAAFYNTPIPIRFGSVDYARLEAWNNVTKNFADDLHLPVPPVRTTLGNRIPIVLECINEDISILQTEARIQNLVRDVEFVYWDLYLAYFRVETAQIAAESAAQVWKLCSSKDGKSSNNAEAQARVTYHQFKTQLDAAIAGTDATSNDLGLHGHERKLRLLMGWADSDGRVIRPSDKPIIGRPDFNWVSISEETLNRNIDLRQQLLSIKQSELELWSAQNKKTPDTQLGLSYREDHLGRNRIDKSGQDAPSIPEIANAIQEPSGEQTQEGNNRNSLSSSAFGSRRRLNMIQNKQLALAREHRAFAAKEIAANHRLHTIWQQLNQLHIQLIQQFQYLSASQTTVVLSQSKCDVGESSYFEAKIENLTRALQTRSDASLKFIHTFVDYNKSLVELHALKGSLLDYNHIKIESAAQSPK